MEGPAGNYFEDCSLFFVLGASDELIRNLKKTAIRVSMRLNSSLEYLLNMPISQFMDMVQEIIEMDEEDKRRRQKR